MPGWFSQIINILLELSNIFILFHCVLLMLAKCICVHFVIRKRQPKIKFCNSRVLVVFIWFTINTVITCPGFELLYC